MNEPLHTNIFMEFMLFTGWKYLLESIYRWCELNTKIYSSVVNRYFQPATKVKASIGLHVYETMMHVCYIKSDITRKSLTEDGFTARNAQLHSYSALSCLFSWYIHSNLFLLTNKLCSNVLVGLCRWNKDRVFVAYDNISENNVWTIKILVLWNKFLY